MDAIDLIALNRRRNLWRAAMLVCIALEAAAVALLFTGRRAPGLALGLAGLTGYYLCGYLGKRAYGEGCARLQTLAALKLAEPEYEGRRPMDVQALRDTGLLPASFAPDALLCLHAVSGMRDARRAELCELTFCCRQPGRSGRAFNSGVLATLTLDQPVTQHVLLLGKAPFRQPVTREGYEAEGMKLCPVGGKDEGWYAMTPDGQPPEDGLIKLWKPLLDAADGRVALCLKENRVHAYFHGSFYTDTYSLRTPATGELLFQCLFPQFEPLLALAGYHPPQSPPAREG